jgi:hypothetical protein
LQTVRRRAREQARGRRNLNAGRDRLGRPIETPASRQTTRGVAEGWFRVVKDTRSQAQQVATARPASHQSDRDVALKGIDAAYQRAAVALCQLRDAPGAYSLKHEKPTTDVAEEAKEALDRLLRLALKSARFVHASPDWWAGPTLDAIEPVVEEFLAFLRRPDKAKGERLRKVAAHFAGYRPDQGEVETIVTLANAVRHAIHPSLRPGEGEAQWIARELLPRLGAKRPVEPVAVQKLLESWAPRSTKGKRAVAGIVAEIGRLAGISLSVAGDASKSISTTLQKKKIANTPQLLVRADGSIPGRSMVIAFEPLSFSRRR